MISIITEILLEKTMSLKKNLYKLIPYNSLLLSVIHFIGMFFF